MKINKYMEAIRAIANESAMTEFRTSTPTESQIVAAYINLTYRNEAIWREHIANTERRAAIVEYIRAYSTQEVA